MSTPPPLRLQINGILLSTLLFECANARVDYVQCPISDSSSRSEFTLHGRLADKTFFLHPHCLFQEGLILGAIVSKTRSVVDDASDTRVKTVYTTIGKREGLQTTTGLKN